MRFLFPAVLLALLSGCGEGADVTRPADASAIATSAHYTVTKYPASLGGSQSRGMAISNSGVVAGWSNTFGNGARHAVVWRDGALTDLGTLGQQGGLSSTVPWPGLNNNGMVVGISQTDEVDPLDESWSCEEGGFVPNGGTNLACRGFVWENGVMQALPTFGGTHGFTTAVNNQGQVVGWAETTVHDPTCVAPQVLQFRAAMWEPKKDAVTELPPFPGDSTSAATAINQRGQAVGISGDCDIAVGRFSARHAVLWDHGRVREIPNLGGSAWHTPMDVNDSGVVVGFSNPPGLGDPEGEFIAHAFLWDGGSSATDLGVLDGDAVSEALAINARGQVVGVSFGGSAGSRAFLYQNGAMRNLNDLVDSDDVLLSAQDINDAGVITGRLLDHVTGETVMYVAEPR
jgi:probable HAF family extracellular repeat protein